ncbi:hypothetical protein [Vreelandella nigrificans]|uniref:hypothetical protein n=1 Tax=Vreelandella nigrificans TaxID=2042704 RepID=UPI001FCC47AF|nr:hypothetical protein [Halomonas nigrificans]
MWGDLLFISETTIYCPLKGDVTYYTPMWRGAMSSRKREEGLRRVRRFIRGDS